MDNNLLENIAFQESLKQSEVFGKQYEECFDLESNGAFSGPTYSDVQEILVKILMSYESLTAFQQSMLGQVFNALNTVRHLIDPNRLKPFEHYLNSDGELLLYRKTSNGLINIIFNPEDCIAYSFIGTTTNKRVLEFYEENGDFEGLVYRFFSY